MDKEKLCKLCDRYDIFMMTGKSCSICGGNYANRTEYDDERKGCAFLCENCGTEITFLEEPKPYIVYKENNV